MLGAEVANVRALKIEHADDLVFVDDGNGELGADIFVGGDIGLGFGDVVDEEGATGERDLADNAVANGDGGALDLGGVTDLEADAEVFAALVDEQDGEDAVGNDGAHEFSGAFEQGAEVERGVEHLGEADQIAIVPGIDAHVDGVEVGAGGWAVVALELRFGLRLGG